MDSIEPRRSNGEAGRAVLVPSAPRGRRGRLDTRGTSPFSADKGVKLALTGTLNFVNVVATTKRLLG